MWASALELKRQGYRRINMTDRGFFLIVPRGEICFSQSLHIPRRNIHIDTMHWIYTFTDIYVLTPACIPAHTYMYALTHTLTCSELFSSLPGTGWLFFFWAVMEEGTKPALKWALLHFKAAYRTDCVLAAAHAPRCTSYFTSLTLASKDALQVQNRSKRNKTKQNNTDNK